MKRYLRVVGDKKKKEYSDALNRCFNKEQDQISSSFTLSNDSKLIKASILIFQLNYNDFVVLQPMFCVWLQNDQSKNCRLIVLVSLYNMSIPTRTCKLVFSYLIAVHMSGPKSKKMVMEVDGNENKIRLSFE